MNPLVLYHDNCADGFGAAYSAWTVLGASTEYRACAYDDTLTVDDVKDRDVYLLDFSFDRQTTDMILANASKFVWLDHHKTAFEMYCGIDYDYRNKPYVHIEECAHIVLNNDHSGAMLAWRFFQPHEAAPVLIKHIDDHDRWQFKMNGTKAFSRALWAKAPWSFQQWHALVDMLEFAPNYAVAYEHMLADGEAILMATNQMIENIMRHDLMNGRLEIPSPDGSFTYVDVVMVNCIAALTSDLGNSIAREFNKPALIWRVGDDGTVRCSLRSIGTEDVSGIAEALGGGGHRNAAGFPATLEDIKEWMVKP